MSDENCEPVLLEGEPRWLFPRGIGTRMTLATLLVGALIGVTIYVVTQIPAETLAELAPVLVGGLIAAVSSAVQHYFNSRKDPGPNGIDK